jgi:predicted membrane-bound spermidine synthase
MVIRRVGVWSVSRLYGALSAVAGLLIGAIIALVATLGGMAGAMRSSESGVLPGGLGALFGVGAIIFLPLCYGVLGLVMGAIGAALYNLFAGMFGGIELETEP